MSLLVLAELCFDIIVLIAQEGRPILVAPYHAIVRYYRYNTPCRAMLFKGG